MVGRADGLFVSITVGTTTISERSNGNIALIEDMLGIPSGNWQGKGGIYRIDIINPENFDLRMPNGNEIGSNEFWTPGGHLPDGSLEAITNQIPKSDIIATKIIS